MEASAKAIPSRAKVRAFSESVLPCAVLARPADCYVEVEGLVVIDGGCDFRPLGSDGSFQVATPRGDYFVQVLVTRPGLADGWWNEERWDGHAHSPLGRLARNDACWSNAATTVCAW